MPGPDHELTVAYAEVVVAGATLDLTGWECWTHRTGAVVHHYAAGPCPACGARVQGHTDDATHPIESLGAEDVRRGTPPAPEPVEVPVRCTCGHDHGHDGATGCGRRWSIVCPGTP